MQYGRITYNKIENIDVFSHMKKRCNYQPCMFNFQNVAGDAKYVRLCVIDTGVPQHSIFNHDLYKSKNFTKSGSVYDVYGHSTALAGVLQANKNNIKGMIPSADIYYAKAIDDEPSMSSLQNIIEAILWCVIKEVDVILMSFSTPINHSVFADVVKKAYKAGVAMIAASGDNTVKTHDLEYPALYKEVFSVGHSYKLKNNQNLIISGQCKGVIMPYEEYDTTFLANKYIKFGGSSVCAAAVAGLACLCVQEMRRKGIDPRNPQLLYDTLAKYTVKN